MMAQALALPMSTNEQAESRCSAIDQTRAAHSQPADHRADKVSSNEPLSDSKLSLYSPDIESQKSENQHRQSLDKESTTQDVAATGD